jgi:hypothetical protein
VKLQNARCNDKNKNKDKNTFYYDGKNEKLKKKVACYILEINNSSELR